MGLPLLFLALIFAAPAFAKDANTSGVVETQATYKSAGKTVNVDVFAPAGTRKHAAVLVLHGGGGLRSKDKFHRISRYFAGHGYVALFPHYLDVTGMISVPDSDLNQRNFALWKESIHDAIGFATQQPNVDANRIAIVSFSLGSFLALDLVPEDRRVGALAEFYGGLSLFKKADVKRMPPVLILHGAKDDSVPVARAYELEKALQQVSSPYEIKVYVGEEHGFSPEGERDALNRSIAFFKKYLTPPKAISKHQRLQ